MYTTMDDHSSFDLWLFHRALPLQGATHPWLRCLSVHPVVRSWTPPPTQMWFLGSSGIFKQLFVFRRDTMQSSIPVLRFLQDLTQTRRHRFWINSKRRQNLLNKTTKLVCLYVCKHRSIKNANQNASSSYARTQLLTDKWHWQQDFPVYIQLYDSWMTHEWKPFKLAFAFQLWGFCVNTQRFWNKFGLKQKLF